MNRKGVEELPEDVIHVIINPTIWLIEEQCLSTLMARLFMVRIYSAVGFLFIYSVLVLAFFLFCFCFGFFVLFFIKQGEHLGGRSSQEMIEMLRNSNSAHKKQWKGGDWVMPFSKAQLSWLLVTKPNCHLPSLRDHPCQTDGIPWHAGSWVILVQFGFLGAMHWWRLFGNLRLCSWIATCISSTGLGFSTELWVCSSNRASVNCAEDHFVMTGHCHNKMVCWFVVFFSLSYDEAILRLIPGWSAEYGNQIFFFPLPKY